MRKETFFVLYYFLVVILAFICNQPALAASGSPNNISIQTQPAQSVAQQTQTVNNGNNNQLELAKEQLRGDFYKYLLVIFGTVLGILVTIIILLIGYARWSNKKEYEKAVAEADKALERIQVLSDKAEDHCEKARNYEQQAQEKLASIEKTVTSKLKDIDEQAKSSLEKIKEEGKKQIDVSIKEGERQRKVSELWNKALRFSKEENHQSAADCYKQIVEDYKEETDWAFNNWGIALYQCAKNKDGEQADKLFIQACEKYQKATKIKPDMHETFYNWGAALSKWAQKKEGEQADKLFIKAYEKYQRVIEIQPDMYDAFNSWGASLIDWAKQKDGNKREEILKQAEEQLLKAESIKTGSGSYNLACLYGIRGDKEKCKQWLEIAQKEGRLVIRKHAMEDKDLEIVRNEEWFKNLRFKGE